MANKKDDKYEEISAISAGAVMELLDAGSESIILTAMVPGDQPCCASHMTGKSTDICAMLMSMMLRLSPADFQSLLRLMHEAPNFELHRNPTKKAMVN